MMAHTAELERRYYWSLTDVPFLPLSPRSTQRAVTSTVKACRAAPRLVSCVIGRRPPPPPYNPAKLLTPLPLSPTLTDLQARTQPATTASLRPRPLLAPTPPLCSGPPGLCLHIIIPLLLPPPLPPAPRPLPLLLLLLRSVLPRDRPPSDMEGHGRLPRPSCCCTSCKQL